MTDLLALSIKQPWLSAILLGDKRVENRSWAPPVSIFGQIIALHASQEPDWGAPDYAWLAAEVAPYRGARRKVWTANLTLGAVAGVARVTGHHPLYHICNPTGVPETVCSRWAAWGEHHWLLDDVRDLPEPIPCRGALGLWRLPLDVEAQARKQLEASNA